MVNRFDGYRLDLPGGTCLQGLDDVAVGLDQSSKSAFSSPTVPSWSFSRLVSMLSTFMLTSRPVHCAARDDPALVIAIVGGVAVRRPDHADEDNRADRDHADRG